MSTPTLHDRLAALRADERGEAELDTGLTYPGSDPVRIQVRKRGHRYDLSDDGAATDGAGKPTGWLEAAERVVAEDGFNVKRSGAVFVGSIEGRDIATLALRLAETSRRVYVTLLELGEGKIDSVRPVRSSSSRSA